MTKKTFLLKNATILITETIDNLMDKVFPGEGFQRKVPASYKNIYDHFSSIQAHYNFTKFLDKIQCLKKIQYDYHSTFLEIKWWAKNDLHKSGLIWGNFDIELVECPSYFLSFTYSNSQKFFFGFMTASLHKNWSPSIVNLVSEDNFNFESILSDLSTIAENSNRSAYDPIEWSQSVSDINSVMDGLIQSLFPDGIVPTEYSNVYSVLTRTKQIHSDCNAFWELICEAREKTNIEDFIDNKIIPSAKVDNSSAGFLWQKLLQILVNNTSLRSKDEFGDSDIQSRLFLSGHFLWFFLFISYLGFLDTTLRGDWNKTFLNYVNFENFPYDIVLDNLVLLSNVNFAKTLSIDDQNKIWVLTKKKYKYI